MAIICYSGVMGSGKSYEAVATAALTALRSGRRLVTNISGFNFEAVRSHLGELRDGGLLQPEKVLVVPTIRITEPHFFFDPDQQVESVVQPGDLVLIDEVWQFWGSGSKLSEEHQKFFRMHRHYTESSTGTSCDVVLMTQDLGSLNRFIRNVLETNLKFTKLKALGLTSRYRVEVYEGGKQTKAALVSANVKKYDARIFPLYKSYDGAHGNERVVDGRQNLFNNKWFVSVLALALFGLVLSSGWFVRYVRHLQSGPGESAVAHASPASASALTTAAVTPQVFVGSDVRLLGVVVQRSGEALALIQLSDGRIIHQRMDAGVINAWQSTVGYQGRMVGFSFAGKTK